MGRLWQLFDDKGERARQQAHGTGFLAGAAVWVVPFSGTGTGLGKGGSVRQ